MGYKLPEDATYYRSETDGYAIYNAECKFIGRAPKNEFAVLNTSLQMVILKEEKPMAEIMKCDLKEIQPGMYICSVSDDMRADLEEK